MFGLIFFAFIGICGVIWQVVQVYENQVTKDITDKDKWNGYYHSMHGGDRDIRTGQQVMVIDEYESGDTKVYSKHGILLHNLTEERRQSFFAWVKELPIGLDGGCSVYWYDLKETYEGELKDIKGCRYKDRETGHLYVIREFNTKSEFELLKFYMDITPGNEGHLVRMCEVDEDEIIRCQKYNRPYPSSEADMQIVQEFIDEFNRKQDINIKNKGKDSSFAALYYHNPKYEAIEPQFLGMKSSWESYNRSGVFPEYQKHEETHWEK